MSFQTIYTVLALAVYFYFQYRKWKKNAEQNQPKPQPVPAAPVATAPAKPKPAKKAPKPAPKSLEESVFSYDSPQYIKAAREKSVENTNPYVYNAEKELLTEERQSLFTEYTAAPTINPYAEKLKQPATLKEAFIFAEILNRKTT